MAQNIKIPIHQLNKDKLKELQEKYPKAEVNLILQAEPGNRLNEQDFY